MQKNKSTWVMFDVGGVILNWFDSSKNFAEKRNIPHEELLLRFHQQIDDLTLDTRMHTGKIDPQEAWTSILKDYDVDVNIEQLIEEWCLPEYWYKETFELMDDLVSNGYSVGILSNSWFAFNKAERRKMFPSKLFSYGPVIDSSEIGMMKPDPSIYEYVEDMLGVPAGEIAFVDDNQDNLRAAENRGWNVYYFDSRSGRQGISDCIRLLREQLL
ncbi:MAG: HAD-IA family hydrolase [Candidatus Saccharibacteria bacterium]